MSVSVLSHWWERSLLSKSGRQVLAMFWVVFLVAGVSAAAPAQPSTVFGIVTQLALGLFWFGYPIALYRCLSADKHSNSGVVLLVAAIALGYSLSVFASSESGSGVWGVVAPASGVVLVFSPFVAGAVALKNAENQARLKSAAGVAVTALALFAFPFFGAYVHERFRRAHAAVTLTKSTGVR